MIYTLEELKEKIIPIAEKYQLPAVFIFGSYARREATEDSDVDVLVDDSIRFKDDPYYEVDLHSDLCVSLEKEVDLVTINSIREEEFQKRRPIFYHNLLSESVMIYEK